ncbi:hypothetical protein GCM10022409_35570 [Hymenobacter glaciei]|uniref:Outer membrane protein beta-barrel domain-containing protein n=1 Tax=Hymenobacter glaciei TaxID=877209 RepID=A0ABP7ULV2_9BACT
MSANPIENNTTPKTTGSLEELFRHHLGEEAAVPPRPMLWDQIDNSLLIRQNETYRRRLVATRWVAAASLLLASLAGTGWWVGRTDLVGSPEMATTTVSRPAANDAQLNSATTRPSFGAAGNAGSTAVSIGAVASAADGDASGRSTSASPDVASTAQVGQRRGLNNAGGTVLATFGGSGRPMATSNSAGQLASNEATTVAMNAASEPSGTQAGTVAAQGAKLPGSAAEAANSSIAANGAVAIGGTTTTAAGATLATGSAGTAAMAVPTTASVSAASLSASVAAAPATTLGAEEAGLLASRMVALGTVETPAPALPSALAAGPEPTELALGTHRWQYGASYTASAFNPNINFSRAGIEPEFGYNPVLGPAELSERAATEYRQNLHAGFSQRLALTVARSLRGHWSLGTGVEFTKANARSASTVAFVGEQIADGGQTVGSGQRRTTDFSYTMASLPLELRYSNSAKRGWSLYGRLGGVVSALLGNRSEVAGRPEVTQTYSITSASTPYRRLTSSVRGAAGARFSPGAGRWAFSMGPVAELGLVSLNAHPVQNYFAQSHPYSVGVEAAVEFGR